LRPRSGARRLPIETERLVIRPLRIEDAEELHELYTDREAMQHLTSNPTETLEQSREWVQSKIDLYERDNGMSLWAMVERSSGDVVGDIGLQWEAYDGERVADLGCRVVRRRWGEGFATEASRAVLAAGFGALGVEPIYASTNVENARARRLLELLGAEYEREVEWYGWPMALYAFRPHPTRFPS
jgi:[ribosomal protein S5]-alanine N-acetyltransferase